MKMKRIALILSLVMLVCSFGATGALAADDHASPDVRVNGKLVEFPDASPYIDGNGRTMIPVRFVAENLGAKVTWLNSTRTANIEKDGILVAITIGDDNLSVTEDNVTSEVKMDTAAVLKNDRTYVPIRFVAEALGAFVDYSGTYRTVGIYGDLLTPEEIKTLQSLPYTQPTAAVGYEEASERFEAEAMEFYYGTGRESFDTFANAREHLYRIQGLRYADTFYSDIVGNAIEALSVDNDHMTIKFLTDTSCIYQSDSMDLLTCAVRGIAEVELRVGPQELTGEEATYLCKLGFTQLNNGTMYIPVDAHMNTTGNVGTLHTIAPAGSAY